MQKPARDLTLKEASKCRLSISAFLVLLDNVAEVVSILFFLNFNLNTGYHTSQFAEVLWSLNESMCLNLHLKAIKMLILLSCFPWFVWWNILDVNLLGIWELSWASNSDFSVPLSLRRKTSNSKYVIKNYPKHQGLEQTLVQCCVVQILQEVPWQKHFSQRCELVLY